MPVATIEIPEPLYERLRKRAEESGASVDVLIVQAVEESYPADKGGTYLTGPLITDKGPRGPLYPRDENPHDLILP